MKIKILALFLFFYIITKTEAIFIGHGGISDDWLKIIKNATAIETTPPKPNPKKSDCLIKVENPKNSKVYSTRFTYDHTTKECVEIIYGGDAEKNIYWTEEDCEKVCKGV
ncbi:kunitz-type U1-aranetoxin-Av1a-like [Belonocnema kinseyi]|uniref:kunitz-type U1-aranetoxin-Av1a-like n=1 Tax=Belonocnema kinseyi TaxID=2817044 RepID=UPI00143DE763|nr:kunitz-type U1-aranetoxin-Av1a-like [Belonocnema kinseyi]